MQKKKTEKKEQQKQFEFDNQRRKYKQQKRERELVVIKINSRVSGKSAKWHINKYKVFILEHAHPTHMHTRIHARTHTGVKVWVASSVCTYFDVRWEKSGRQVYAIAERKAKSSSYTL